MGTIAKPLLRMLFKVLKILLTIDHADSACHCCKSLAILMLSVSV
ncbi:DUF717 domain-containing protein [Shewanella vesiculosa]|nr:DUF717 domain-containing protein [Shewanella vesiculosa]